MKKNSTIAVIGSKAEEFCRAAAKKGGETDYRLWHASSADKIITLCEPFRWPEKMVSLAYCLNLSQHAVIAQDSPDAAFGEALIALDLLGMKSGCFATEYGLEEYAKGTAAEKYEVKPFNEAIEWARQRESKPVDGPAKIVVDESFNVKGVGQVLLGFVERGTVRVHDKLTAYPSKAVGRSVEVRSIQVQDEDVGEAGCFSRVGLCFKGSTTEEISRGKMLSAQPIQTAIELELRVQKSRYANKKEFPRHLHACFGLQSVPCEAEWSADSVRLRFGEPVAYDGEKALLYDLNRGLPRVVASAEKN